MSRALYAGCFLGWLIMAAGCAMCAHPYDYCGPVIDDPQACCPNARAGSILAPNGMNGVPEGTIKSRVYYGLRALRNVLEEMGYEG